MWTGLINSIFVLFLAINLTSVPPTSSSSDKETINYSIGNGSELNITGTSNITDFCCSSQQSFPQGDLTYEWISANRIAVSNARLVIDANTLDCGRKPITKDFKRTLKVDEHPNIIFLLHEIAFREELSEPTEEWNWAIADTEIVLAGCSNHKFMDVQYKMEPDNSIKLRAFQRLCVSDFGLESPKPMLGMIKVDDEVDVEIFMNVKLEGQG